MRIRFYLFIYVLFWSVGSFAQSISLVNNRTASILANTIKGKGITIPSSGMTLNCHSLANGTFVNVNPTPTLSLAIDSGIVLCTGKVLTTTTDTGINAHWALNASNNLGITTTDPQITSIAGAAAIQRDLCYLEFSFIPRGDTAFIDYAFASEDYPEYVCLQYVDAVGIFVAPPSGSYTNYTKVPGTNINVSVNSINDTSKQTGAANYAGYCQSLGSGAPFIQYYTANLINNHIVYDGMTKTLRARIPVQPNLTHTMKIAIADILDGFFDSGIFIDKSSFESPPLLELIERKGTNGQVNDTNVLIEGCNSGQVKFSRSSISNPITVNVSYSGTASGGDYTAATSFTIPVGSNNFTYNIQALADAINEPLETLKVTFSVPSINFVDSAYFIIKDFANSISVFNGKKDTTLCIGQNIQLNYTKTDTSFSAFWTPSTNLSCTSCTSTTYTANLPNVASTQTVYLRISAIGCTSVDSPINIHQQPKPSIVLTPSYSICKGDSVFLSPTITPAGSYTYTWSPASFLSSSSIINPIAKPTNTQTYKLVVSSSYGCKDSSNTTINISNIRLEIDSMRIDNTTCGASNGAIRLYTKNINPAYSYSINGGGSFQSSGIFTGLSAGGYNVAIKNGNGCRFDTTLNLSAGTNAPSATYSVTNTTCGLNNGSAKILTKSGIPPLTIAWKFGATVISNDTMISSRVPGVYTLSITDSAGCIVQYTFNIQTSAVPNFFFIKTDQTCGLNNGSITANATSGAPAFTYLWSNGATTPTINSLTAGVYKLTFTDSKGCVKVDSTTIIAFPPITSSKVGVNATCGASNGSAQAIISSGGTAPFTYYWSNGVTSAPTSNLNHTISGLSGGKYKFTIQDAKGCIAIDSAILTASPALVISVNRTNATCGINNGSIALNILSGTPSYAYSWNDGATTQNRTSLAPGSYQVTVTDINSCTASGAAVVTMTSSPTLNTTKINPSCGQNNGRISTSITGAQPPVIYAWSNGSNSNFIDNLSPGVYTVTITDSLGCQKIKTDTLIQPIYSNFIDSLSQPKCGSSNGAIYLYNIVGSTPISIIWSDGNTSATRTGLSPGNYSVLIQDANGCQKSKTFTLNTSTNPTINLAANHAKCGILVGGVTSTISNGVLPYNYTWSSGETTPNIISKSPGIYTLSVIDSKGCTATKSDTIKLQPSPTYLDSFKKATCDFNNGRIFLYNIVGAPPYTFNWSHDVTLNNPIALGVPGDTIIVIITDSNGCVARDTFDLSTKGAIKIQSSIVRSKCKDSTGKITINITNGTTPYNINWSNGDTGLVADSLKHGLYGLEITDSFGCIYLDSIKVNDSTTLKDTFQIVKTRCDTASGTILALPIGGTSPFKHIWQRLPRDTFALLDSVSIGVYNVQTIDSNGCKFDTFANMTYTHYPQIKDSIVPETCAGGNAEIHISIDSVIYPIQIFWNTTLDSVYSKTNLKGPVNYTITVIDSHKCTLTRGVFIDTFMKPQPLLTTVMPPCGNNLGSISVAADPPTVLQTYSWSNSASTSSISNLAPGIYTLTVTDTSGCIFVLSDTLAYTLAPTIQHSVQRSNCGRSDGQIRSIVTSPYGGFNYKWKKITGAFNIDQSAADTAYLTPLDFGIYVVQITDTKGCIKFDTLPLIDSAAPSLIFQIKNAHCTNGNGKAKVIAQTGSAPFDYLWYNFSTADSITSLFGGSYLITVTDDRGCVTIDTAIVDYVPSPDLNLIGINSFCGPSNGKIITNVSYGQAPFAYNWSNGATTKDLTNLTAGKYILTITDSAGCIDIDSVSIVAQPPLHISISKKDASCDINNGNANATILSGKPPYIFHWNSVTTSLSISGLDTGLNIFYISDSNNCEIRDTIKILRVPKHIVSHTVINDNCTYKIGRINTSVTSGKPPYTYNWSNSLGTNPNVLNVGAGSYTLSVTDSMGCVVPSVVNVGDTAGPIVSLIVNEATCGNSNGSINANVISIRTPLNYFWNNISGTNSISGINGGKYVFKVIDNRGCVKQDSVILDTIKPLIVNLNTKNATCNLNNGYIKVNAAGGTGTKSYSWSHTGANVDSVFGLAPAKYKVTVSDTKGCLWVDSFTITQLGLPIISFSKTPSTCRNANGNLQSTITNASGAITYAWNTGNTGANLINLTPNNYTLTVTDATGCSNSASILLNSIGVDSVYLDAIFPKCNINNGKIKALPFNTSGTVNYIWNTGANKDSIVNLGGGSYSVTVSDNLCSFIRTANLVMAPSPIVSLAKQDASCNINNGQITSNISLGTSPFSYVWNGSIGPFELINIDSGAYKLVVTDINGCKDSASTYLPRIPMLKATLTPYKSKCGLPNGSIVTAVTGGKTTYHFQWSNGDTIQSLNNILAGNYTLTLSDDGNCTITESILVEDRLKPKVIANITASVCDKPNGAISTTVLDGTPPFTYLWSTGATSSSIANISQGLYKLTVTDNIGCIDSITAQVISGSPPDFDYQTIYRSTCGLPNGSIVTKMSVRAINPVYTWSTGVVNDTLSNVGPGTYYLTVTDDRQCEIIDTFIMPTTLLPKINLSIAQSYCLKPNGQVFSVVTEGTSPYQYIWNTGATSPTINGLFPNQYALTVTDSLGCRDSAKILLTEEKNEVQATYDTFNLKCYRDNSGRVKFYPSGGQNPYTFIVYNSTLDSITYGLSAGKHYFTIIDNRGCEYKDSFSLNEPPPLVTKITYKKDLICNNQPDGEIHVETSGGIFPYTYKWSPSGFYGDRASGLYAGEHTVAVTDLKGCKDTLKQTLIQPNAILIVPSKTNNLCYGQSKAAIDINVSNGTPPYQYLWSNKMTTKNISGLSQGSYSLQLIDSNGCIARYFDTIVDPPIQELGNIKATNLICPDIIDGMLEVSGIGGVSPYQYSIDSGKSFSFKNKFINLPAGNYYVLIRDKENCHTYVKSLIDDYPKFTINANPNLAEISLGESVQLGFDVIQGSSSWINQINWRASDGLSCIDCASPIASPYISSTYVVEVDYLNRCKTFDTLEVIVLDKNELFIPNAFTPASEKENNKTFRIFSNNVLSAYLLITDRWGEIVFDSKEAHLKGWNGEYKGEPALAGTYTYYAEVEYLNQRKVIKRGTFILIR